MTLVALNVDNFREVVELDIRGEASQSQKNWLRKDENVERWYWELIAVKKNIESQLGIKRSNLRGTRGLSPKLLEEKRQDYYAWKAKILRFKSATEEKIIEARQLRRTSWLREDVVLDERNIALETVSILRKAIVEHQRESITVEPSEADRKLWNML